jgi:hypothetical protein
MSFGGRGQFAGQVRPAKSVGGVGVGVVDAQRVVHNGAVVVEQDGNLATTA